MVSKDNKIDFEDLKRLDFVDYLASIGHHPTKIRGNDCWFVSPFRHEKTASFKVNRAKNVWYDHGAGVGGTIIDFLIQYFKVPKIDIRMFNRYVTPDVQKVYSNLSQAEQSPLKIINEKEINSIGLLRYLKQRRIDESIAKKYCKEVAFTNHGKLYTAIGFKNDQGGFELRNQWFKGSSSPKGITHLQNDASEVAVFEGFFNFLAYQTISKSWDQQPKDFIVLNSTSFFEKSRETMEQYDKIKLFLDRDNAGNKLTANALSSSIKYSDESKLYEGYKDINEWTQHIGKSNNKGLSVK